MNPIIEKALEKSFTYKEYRNYITQLFKSNKVTGNEQSEDLLHYTELNEARMNRLEKTINVTDENKLKLEKLEKDYLWLVISEGWCGDSAQIIPVIYKMAEVSDKVELKIVFRDENDDLMNLFLTNGSRSIPKLIIIDKTSNEVVGEFGPRPNDAKQLILDYKVVNGIVDETAKIELHKWYTQDKGISTQKEIMNVI
ncbi:thioredoxin family protein [Flavobacterium capsici]|uniref:Thioredoxin family protein n=1 Tax=Flavobacterium capsici TaxID=3075618 RepID=A0AA96J3X4_9FLAO|nr:MULTISPECIES: thioredoxin family protein [unclassified Flavobacterium]WNM19873.1 thioredoxin family protein [Flavobacterium sp. PMR2A8]WNM21262.1 thioredoxin family protein [Flavobacterium sp. PMTSA4]